MVPFRKQEDCPPSQELLSYQLGELAAARSRVVGRHLTACEFCSSEVGFYEHYGVSGEPDVPEPAKMPEPLYELAESLLNRKRGKQSIARMMSDIDPGRRGKN